MNGSPTIPVQDKTGTRQKRPFPRLITISGAVLALLSAACFARAEWVDRHTRWLPVVLPLQLVEGFRTETDFTLDLSGTSYEVEVRCRWAVPLSEDLLSDELGVSCELREDGRPVESGKIPPTEGFRGAEGRWLSATLCEFSGRAGHRYHVLATVDRSSSVLAPAESALVVRLDPSVAKDLEGDIWLMQIAGWTTGVFAFGLVTAVLFAVCAANRLALSLSLELLGSLLTL